ncbi:hypothetical protein SAMN05421678_11527 [Actinopolymorpha cephalotaxi]|uniref:DUF6542 domain-containing protein n=1 Tax=Actinopolymorpha cephalotaxi TaxID=504797 RepID=A0A1I2YUV0_9ACTN|nr:hypothetical protein SAMN05421678_11527 [Actinopolymorpha cephalotaxi]
MQGRSPSASAEATSWVEPLADRRSALVAAEENQRGRDDDASSPPPPRAERAQTGVSRSVRPPIEAPRRERPPIDPTWRERPSDQPVRRPGGRRVATSAAEVPPSPERPAVRGRRVAFPLPADLPTRAERAAWPPPTTGIPQSGSVVDERSSRADRAARPGRRARVSSPTPDTSPDVELDEHEVVLPRLPRTGEHRPHPLPVALSDDHPFEPDLDPRSVGGRRGPAHPSPEVKETGADSAAAGRRRRADEPSESAEPEPDWRSVLAQPATSGSDDLTRAERPQPEPEQQPEPERQPQPDWRSVLAQRPEAAQPEPPSADRPLNDVAERDATPVPSPATRRPVDRDDRDDHADIPQDLRPRGLRRAEDTEESGSQTVTDTRRQAARPPARPQPELRGPVEPAQRRTGRRNTDPHEMGMPAFVAVLVGVGGSVLGAFLDILVTGGVGLLFSLCFVLTAFGVAAAVRRTGMFTAGVLPPFAALASLVVVAAVDPQRIATTASPVRAVLVGLAWESWTIVAGCAVALVTIAVRAVFARRARVSPPRRPAEAYAAPEAARRSGSPRRS